MKVLQLSNNQMSFGGVGGDFASIQDVGGQTVIIQGDTFINSIQIGNKKYGDGGSQQALFTLPQTGKFQILELSCSDYLIQYIKLQCQDTIYTAGTEQKGKLVFGGGGISVTFAGIFYGAAISALLFNTV